jgi:hypothetical protein
MAITPERKKYLEEFSLRELDSQKKTSENAVENINKIIFTVSAGTFVLSISFVGYLKSEIVWPWLLIAAWVFLAGCLAINTYAHWLTYNRSTLQMKHINASRSKGFEPEWGETMEKDGYLMKTWPRLASRVLVGVFTLLVAGIVCLISFAAANLLSQNGLQQRDAAIKAYLSSSTVTNSILNAR